MDSYKFHHSALARGYVRVGHEVKEPYNGKFGRGYKLYKTTLAAPAIASLSITSGVSSRQAITTRKADA